MKARRGPFFYGAICCVAPGLDRVGSVPDLAFSEVREVSGPNWALSGASVGPSGVLGAVRG